MTKDWTPVHDEIRRLYDEEGEPLHEVMRLVKGKFGFIASERSYRTQLKAWGYTKYSTEASPKPAQKKVRSTRQLSQSVHRSHAISAANHNEPGISDDVLPTNLSDYSSFTGDGMLFNTSHDMNSHPSVPIPSYNHFSIGPQLPAVSQPFPAPSPQRIDGKTPLHDAVVQKNVDSVKTLLFSGHGVHGKDDTGSTPLHHAILADDYDIIKLLVQFGADVNAKGPLGRSPLHSAVMIAAAQAPALGSTRVVDLLIKELAETTSQDDKGDTPLHLALTDNLVPAFSESSHFPVTPPVIETLLKSKVNLNIKNALGVTAFLKLLLQGPGRPSPVFLKLISLFLKAGASATLALPDGRTPLSFFLQSYPEYWIKPTIYKDHYRQLPRWECQKALSALLEAGASIETPTWGSGQPLVVNFFREYYPRYEADVTLARKLCDLCPTNLTLEEGNTILHELVMNRVVKTTKHDGTVGLVDMVIRNGANVNQQNDRGETPLMVLFTRTKNEENINLAEQVMSALLRQGADPRVVDSRNRNPLFESVKTFPKAAEAFLGPLFRASVSKIEVEASGVKNSGSTRAPTTELEWLLKWESTVRQQNWEVARSQITKDLAADGLAADLGPELVRMAYTVLAEHLVQVFAKQHRDGLLGKDEARSQVSNILRTCRERELPVQLQAYDSLLELC